MDTRYFDCSLTIHPARKFLDGTTSIIEANRPVVRPSGLAVRSLSTVPTLCNCVFVF